MDDARAMYQEHILDLYKHPLNFGTIEDATHKYHLHNPLCGDDITIELTIRGGVVEACGFTGKGCAISMASASLVTEHAKRKDIRDVRSFKKDELLEQLGIPLGPVRLKCALLSLEALHNALGDTK